MLYTYTELKQKGLTNYKIKQLVEIKKLFKLSNGLYSTLENPEKLSMAIKLHPTTIVTMYSAFYYYGLLKQEPNVIYLATYQNARKIEDPTIKQIFMTTRLHKIGVNKMTYKGTSFNIYTLERMLIELVRNKTIIPYDVYHEIVNNYRKLVKLINKNRLKEYLLYFRDKKIQERIEKEIFQIE